jgi:hypothetical protein
MTSAAISRPDAPIMKRASRHAAIAFVHERSDFGALLGSGPGIASIARSAIGVN